jgi:polar amino acid transport system substrate-binding protein
VFLAPSQKQIDATVVTSTVATSIIATGRYPGFVITGDAPYDIDYVALIALRQEQGRINDLNLFINQQVRTGRYEELFDWWIGGGAAAPGPTIEGVYR